MDKTHQPPMGDMPPTLAETLQISLGVIRELEEFCAILQNDKSYFTDLPSFEDPHGTLASIYLTLSVELSAAAPCDLKHQFVFQMAQALMKYGRMLDEWKDGHDEA